MIILMASFCSKRSNFITRLNAEKKHGLVVRLTHLAEVSISHTEIIFVESMGFLSHS